MHIALEEVRAFAAARPDRPSGVPFDVWTAGLPEATLLAPSWTDGDGDGRAESLLYPYAIGEGRARRQPAALTAFIDLSGKSTPKDGSSPVPAGLWGVSDGGRFKFDVSITVRADGTMAVGYTTDGVVDEIRVTTRATLATPLVWRRDAGGAWSSSRPGVQAVDASRLGAHNVERLAKILRKLGATVE
jgi:hypothetical protein